MMAVHMKLMFISLAASLLVLTTAQYPCDTADQFLAEFSQCTYSNSSIFITSIFLNSIYSGFSDEIRTEVLDSSSLNDFDEDGRQACGVGIEEIRQCMEPRFLSCSEQLKSTVGQEVDAFRGRFCEQSGETWQYSSLILDYFVDIGQAYLQLFSNSVSEGEAPCLETLFESGIWAENGTCIAEAITTDTEFYMNETSYIEAKERLSSIYGTLIKCLYQEIKKVGCNDDVSIGFLAYMVLFGSPPGVDYSLEDLDELVNSDERPTGTERISVVVFGDPHIISYDGEFLFSTCSAVGERLYLQNNYVTIIGHNSAIEGGQGDTPPTYMTQVTITFTDSEGDEVGTFSFTGGDSLPSTFDGMGADINGGSTGSDENGASVGEASNAVKRIHYRRGGIVIGLKKIGITLAMTVRMEKSLYSDSFGDLVFGCLGQELQVEGNRRKRGTGSEVCTNLGLTGDLLTACEYDVDNTGDTDIVTGQYESIQEMEEAAEELDDTIIVDETTTQASGSGSGSGGHLTSIAAMLIGFMYFL